MISIGLANFVGSFFKCFPVFGYFRRSSKFEFFETKSQIAGVISGSVVMFSVFFLAEEISYIPLVVTSAFSCYNNFKRVIFIKEDFEILKHFRIDLYLYLTCFFACMILGLRIGLLFTLTTSFMFVFKRNSKPVWNFQDLINEEIDEFNNDDNAGNKVFFLTLIFNNS